MDDHALGPGFELSTFDLDQPGLTESLEGFAAAIVAFGALVIAGFAAFSARHEVVVGLAITYVAISTLAALGVVASRAFVALRGWAAYPYPAVIAAERHVLATATAGVPQTSHRMPSDHGASGQPGLRHFDLSPLACAGFGRWLRRLGPRGVARCPRLRVVSDP
jgi:hypothetical protein